VRYVLVLLGVLLPGVAWASCGPADKVAAFLLDNFGEKPQVTFVSPDITYTLYAGPKSWSLVGVKGTVGCIVTEGKAWKFHGTL
jgi:hypothetical protein